MQLLNSLRVAAESNARRRSKVWLYPDYHLDYDKGYEQMTHAELFFGMSCVINDLLEGKSALPRINAKSYAKHMKYVAERGLCKNYKPGTLNRYEHKLTTKVLEGKLESFVSADYDTVASYLGADSMQADAQVQQQSQPQQRQQSQQGGSRRGRRGQGRYGYNTTDCCLKWNYSICDYPQCIKYHVCELCGGQHRAKVCGTVPPHR